MHKPIVCYIHFNKNGSKHGLPWTVHTNGKCIPASEVNINVHAKTVFRPNKKGNPKAWIRAIGVIQIDGDRIQIK